MLAPSASSSATRTFSPGTRRVSLPTVGRTAKVAVPTMHLGMWHSGEASRPAEICKRCAADASFHGSHVRDGMSFATTSAHAYGQCVLKRAFGWRGPPAVEARGRLLMFGGAHVWRCPEGL